jgi:hypothetical protein
MPTISADRAMAYGGMAVFAVAIFIIMFAAAHETEKPSRDKAVPISGVIEAIDCRESNKTPSRASCTLRIRRDSGVSWTGQLLKWDTRYFGLLQMLGHQRLDKIQALQGQRVSTLTHASLIDELKVGDEILIEYDWPKGLKYDISGIRRSP